jgi:hypothetical protein
VPADRNVGPLLNAAGNKLEVSAYFLVALTLTT